jgi:adenylate kinase
MKNKMVIILLGAPGAGKGTQAKLLQKELDLKYIGSGDLLRTRKKKRDFTGIKIGKCIDVGKRVPTPVIFNLWMNKMESFKKSSDFKGFIIDGSPRTLFEAEMLELALGWYEWDKNKRVVFVKISPKESISRLTKRRMCKNCGRNIPYIGEFRNLKKCDKCGGQLIRRADDTIKGVKERLRWFKTDVQPSINYYKKKGELIEVNGKQSIKDVSKDVLKVLKSKR